MDALLRKTARTCLAATTALGAALLTIGCGGAIDIYVDPAARPYDPRCDIPSDQVCSSALFEEVHSNDRVRVRRAGQALAVFSELARDAEQAMADACNAFVSARRFTTDARGESGATAACAEARAIIATWALGPMQIRGPVISCDEVETPACGATTVIRKRCTRSAGTTATPGLAGTPEAIRAGNDLLSLYDEASRVWQEMAILTGSGLDEETSTATNAFRDCAATYETMTARARDRAAEALEQAVETLVAVERRTLSGSSSP